MYKRAKRCQGFSNLKIIGQHIQGQFSEIFHFHFCLSDPFRHLTKGYNTFFIFVKFLLSYYSLITRVGE